MHKLLTAGSVAFFLLATSSVQAAMHHLGPDAGEQLVVAKMPGDWLTCQKGDDCSLIPYNCAEALAVNTKHLSEAKKLTYEIENDPATVNCADAPSTFGPPHYVAGCFSGRCEATNPAE